MNGPRHATRRAPAWLLTILLGVLAVVAVFGPVTLAHAGAAGADVVAQEAPDVAPDVAPAGGHGQEADGDRSAPNPGEGGETGKGTAVLFWLFALMCVGGSIFVITRRNLISAVMGMVGTFFAIAAIYAMLYAHFLAAIQVLVYAGAIMVLFVFVIMILNKPEDEPWRRVGVVGKAVSGLLVFYLVGRLAQVLWSFTPVAGSSRPPMKIPVPGVEEPVLFGSTMAVGHNLFTDYLFPFEAVSLVLLIAIVGAIAVARPHEKPPAAIPADNAPTS